MPYEEISPELALVDPELGARARAQLPLPSPIRSPLRPSEPPRTPPMQAHRASPLWARITAALWLLVLGILVGGTAIPHAQDNPRVVPKNEDAAVCKPALKTPTVRPQPGAART